MILGHPVCPTCKTTEHVACIPIVKDEQLQENQHICKACGPNPAVPKISIALGRRGETCSMTHSFFSISLAAEGSGSNH